MEREWYAAVGQSLRRERARRGWTIYDVAAVVGRTGKWVSEVERAVTRIKAFDYHRLRAEGLVP